MYILTTLRTERIVCFTRRKDLQYARIPTERDCRRDRSGRLFHGYSDDPIGKEKCRGEGNKVDRRGDQDGKRRLIVSGRTQGTQRVQIQERNHEKSEGKPGNEGSGSIPHPKREIEKEMRIENF